MKKIILVSLCLLFVCGSSAFGAYAVSGQVKEPNGSAVVGATVYINCYPAAGGSYSDTRTTVAGGLYAGGWTDHNCAGEKMMIKAVKGNKSGSLAYNATGVAGHGSADINKDITIKPPTVATGELHCEPTPIAISQAYTPVSIPTNLYVQLASPPKNVNGGTTTLTYDSTQLYCASVEPAPPFGNSFSYYESPPGTLHISAYAPGGYYVPVQHGDNPTTFFTMNFAAYDYTTPGIDSFFDVYTEIYTDTGLINGFDVYVEIQIGEPNDKCKPYLRIDKEEEWNTALSSGHVYAMNYNDWSSYMTQWQNFTVQGTPYPNHSFRPPETPTGNLYVYGGGGGGGGGALDPCDAGLVMYWGNPTNGSYSSAWKYDYLLDPDLSNCIVTVAVTAPQYSPGTGAQVNKVSFGFENPPIPGGPIRAWYWNCGAAGSGAPIIWNTPTVLTIDTSKTGVSAATPTASAYANNPGFTLKNVQWLLVDEDANWVGSGAPAPAPGTGWTGLWNYWHYLMISPKTTINKGYYTKWSQPPVILDANADPPTINGWDEPTNYESTQIVADDWKCTDDRPITDIHWWGSFLNWSQPYPPMLPQSFHIGIWTDVPDPDPGDHSNFSHPGTLVWEDYCTNYVWNFAGYDKDPRIPAGGGIGEPNDSCFQFNQLLSQDKWFYQEPSHDPCHPTVYWLSIAPVWGGTVPTYQYGWKTRPHYFNDDAVVIQGAMPWPPVIGSTWTAGYPIQWPAWPSLEGATWDVAFELSTNEPDPTYNAMDFNKDGIVNFFDLAIFADEWLKTGP